MFVSAVWRAVGGALVIVLAGCGSRAAQIGDAESGSIESGAGESGSTGASGEESTTGGSAEEGESTESTDGGETGEPSPACDVERTNKRAASPDLTT